MNSNRRLLGDTAVEVASLRGIPNVHIAVEQVDVPLVRSSESEIRDYVEGALRAEGIHTLAASEFNATATDAALLMIVPTLSCVLKEGPGLFVGTIELHLRQRAKLERDPACVVAAVTWMTGMTFAASNALLSEMFHECLAIQVERFIRSFRTANS